MNKKLISFPDKQIKQIKKLADKNEISFTEMVRRIVEFYLNNIKKGESRGN